MLRPLFQQIKKGKFKTFFLFLLLALLFWVLTKFSKEYTDTVKANLVYKDLPENITISGDRFSEINFDMKSNGFEFLYYKIKRPTINLNISSYYNEGMNHINLTKDDLISLLNDQLSNNNSVKNVIGNGIKIILDNIITLKFPVSIQTEIQFKEGYKNIGDISSVPDSVLVSGPFVTLSKIENIKSEEFKKVGLDHTISEDIKLIKPSENDVTIEPDMVSISIVVKEFTQKQLVLPLILNNVPDGQSVKLIPETITITFDISVDDFNTVSESDFKIICDFAERNDTENSIVLKIEMVPENIMNVELDVNTIEYLIFK